MNLIGFLFAISVASAAPQKMNFKPKPLGKYVANGVVVGGVAGEGFSILRIERLSGTDGAERLAIVYGNSMGQPMKTAPGYFHINVDGRTARVSIDLAQVQKTAVDAAQLARSFKDSKIVAMTEMTMDPVDLSTNILLNFKQPAEVKAQIDNIKGARTLVIDMRPSRGG